MTDQPSKSPPSPSPPSLADIQLQMSMMNPAIYANGVIITSGVGGLKLTFVDIAPEGVANPRVSVFLPGDTAEKMIEFVKEHQKKTQELAMNPPQTKGALN